jgi:nucleotide-binding universal stress UspA family protein
MLAAILREGVDVAAVAIPGRSGITRAIFDGAADRPIREPDKPVLVVKAS